MTTITPGSLNLTLYIGNTFNIILTWKDSNGNSINLTGYTAIMEARYNLTDASPFITFQTGGTPSIVLGSDGSINITAAAGVTSALTPGVALYDLQMTDTLGNVFTLVQGTMIVQEMVTR